MAGADGDGGSHRRCPPRTRRSPAPHPLLNELRRLAPYYGYRAIDGLARVIPTPVATRLGSSVMRSMADRAGERSRVVRAHMRRVLGPHVSDAIVEQKARECFAIYGRYWAETFRIGTLTKAELDAGMEWEGLAHIEEALAKGNGVIIAMPHVGGFDWGGAWLASMYETTVVAETLEPPELFAFFKQLRESHGMEVVGLDEAAGSAILRRLRGNGLVGLVCDRDISGTGAEVDFFGYPTTIPAGPATLALRTGCAILPAAAYFEGDGLHRGVVRPPLEVARGDGGLRDDIQRITQALACEFEHLISLAPEQWHVLQANWPDLLPD